MSFLKPYMTPRRLLAKQPDSENDEYEYHPFAAGEEKDEIIHKIITNMKREVLSEEERLPQSSVRVIPGTSCEHQHLESTRDSSESEHTEKKKKEPEKAASSAGKGLKRKNMVNNKDSSSKQPRVNKIAPDKDSNLNISLANEKSKPKRLRYVTFASNLPNCAGSSSTNLSRQSTAQTNPQSTYLNNTTPVIIMNEKSIEKIIKNFENSNNSNIAIRSVIGNCTATSNGNVVNNTATASSGLCDNSNAITSSGDRPITPLGTSNTEASANNSAQTNISSFFRNVAIQCEIPKTNRDGDITKKQSSTYDTKNSTIAVFIHPKPNLPRRDDESDEDDLVCRKMRVRRYRIPEFRCDPAFANTHSFGNREQIYRAVWPSTSSNGNNGTGSIELFVASIYQTIKDFPRQGQNIVKTSSLEFLKVAEEEFEQVKAQCIENLKTKSSKPQTEPLDPDLTSPSPCSNMENPDVSKKDNQDSSNKNNQDTSGKDNQGTINQGTLYSSGQSYDPISSLQSAMNIFGDNDGRHIALRLFLASLYQSMKNMPSYLLNYLKANLMQLVVHVEEIYNNPEDFRNKAMNNENAE